MRRSRWEKEPRKKRKAMTLHGEAFYSYEEGIPFWR